MKYIIPYAPGTKVRIVNAKTSLWREEVGEDIIQEVSVSTGNWQYFLVKSGAWYHHSQLEKMGDATQATMKAIFKAIKDEYDEITTPL